MNDATPWVDPELVAAGQLLQSRGLVAPDRTKAALSEVRAAQDRIGAFLGEGSVPLRARARPRPARPARAGAVPALSARRGRAPALAGLCPWRRVYAGEPHFVGRDAARAGAPIGRRGAVGRLQALARAPLPQGVRGDGGGDPARRARGGRARHRPDPDRGRRRFGGRQSGARRRTGAARRRGPRAALYAADLRRLFGRQREPVMAALRPGRRIVADPDAVDLGDLSRNSGAAGRTGAPPRFSATSPACRPRI